MLMQNYAAVSMPPVILQNGTAGESTIYMNRTSAKVSVEAPLVYDFVDNNISNVDSNATIGAHSNFTAQQYGPDSLFDNLTEADTGGPVNDTENFVDDNTSNIDGVDDKGTHGNFTAQQYCDSYFDTLTEANIPVSTTYQIHPTEFNDLLNNWNNEPTAWDWNNTTSATETKGKVASSIYWHTWNSTGQGTISQVDLRVRLDLTGLSDDYMTLSWYVGATQGTGTYEINSGNHGTDIVVTFNDVAEPTNGTWEWADIGNLEIRQVGMPVGGPDAVTYAVDEVWGWVSTSTPNFELDLEIRWTTVDYDETDEYLCINVGTTGDEDLKVEVWTGSWTNLLTDLNASSWNNVSVSSYLTSDILIVRFLGGTESGDSNQDSWQIECSLLHVWSWEYNYNLDLEIQWTDANYTRTNEELCIKTGTFSGSENIQAKVWNNTGSSWHWVMNLTESQWNNASITSYLTSSTFTVQFLGGTETGDTSQDSWSIDAALLHVWTPASFGWGAWSEELLVNPGFEMGNLTGWIAKGPAAASVEVFNSTSGGDSYTNRSLRIGNYGVCTKDQPGTNDDSGVWQNVSLAAHASEIDAGNAVINASAWLYPSEWDWDDCALIVRFFNSSGGFISAWNTTGEYGNGTAYYPQAWMLGQGYAHFTQGQLKRFGCYNYTIPIGTRTVGIQLGMGEHKATNYCGGQADEASIKIRTSTWLSGWGKRVKITIGSNDIDSDLSDFPVLVYLSNSSGRNNDDLTFIFDEVGSNGKKIAVTKSDGTTQCYVEIEKWDNASEQAWLWVKVPNLSNITDTILYLYYDVDHPDNTDYVGDTDSTPAENVWDNNYVGVWHLKENPNGTAPQIKDSTLNDNDGTSNGSMNISDQVSGKIDGSLDFDNYDDYINVGDVNSDDWTAITVEGWIYHRDTGDDRVVCKSVGTAIADHTFSLGVPTDTIRVRLGTDGLGGGTTSHDTSGFITPNTWTHVAFSWNSADATLRFYGDGQSRGSASKDGDTIKNSSQVVCIANVDTVNDRYFNGIIDEVRISNTTRSPAWVKASYESGRDDLLDFGASGTSEGTYDYVLRVNNTVAESWQIRLKKYSDSNINRLQNCTIYFHNSTDGTSNQIIIENGSYVNQTGSWYDLGNSETIYIAITVQAKIAATSYVYAYLEIRTPNTTTYAQYLITFEIT